MKYTNKTIDELVTTARKFEVVAKEKEIARQKLQLTAKKLAQTAKENQKSRQKLAVTAKELALIAKRAEVMRLKLGITAKRLAAIAELKEKTRLKLVLTAKELKQLRGTLENNILERTKDLDQATSKTKAILASIGKGIVVVDEEGKISYVNKPFEEMLDWKSKEIIGKKMIDMIALENPSGSPVPPKDRPLISVLGGQNFSTKTNDSFHFVRKNKSRFPVNISATPILLNKKIIGAVVVFSDITNEKEINKAKTEFVSLASHQLRTPLSTVNWYTEMLLAGDVGEVTPEQRKYLEEIYAGNQRMVDLVNTLLDVSRIEMGTFFGDSKRTDVAKLILSVVNEQRVLVDEKKITLSCLLKKKVPHIHTDPKLLKMVVHNLVSNAVKYTPEAGTVAVSLSVQSKKTIILKISDTGYGIPKHQQDKIFTKLFRADNVIGKDTEGTGLGLYIAKSIIEQSGGELWFESEENVGTAFYATMPIRNTRMRP